MDEIISSHPSSSDENVTESKPLKEYDFSNMESDYFLMNKDISVNDGSNQFVNVIIFF
jgi:hypothetical protein